VQEQTGQDGGPTRSLLRRWGRTGPRSLTREKAHLAAATGVPVEVFSADEVNRPNDMSRFIDAQK